MHNHAIADIVAAHGRNGDTLLGHLTPGDVVVPKAIVLKDPAILTRMKKLMEEEGGDYRSHVAGSGHEHINPATGQPEFGFSLKSILHTLVPITGGVKNFVNSIPMIAGAALGSPTAIAQAFSQISASKPKAADMPSTAPIGPQNAPLPTSRPDEASLPSGLGQFAGLNPLQTTSGIATEGLYGGGTSGPENNYFINMLQRQLINDKGGYEDYSQNVNPTSEAFLHNNLGLQFDPNTTSLLQSIANRNAATA